MASENEGDIFRKSALNRMASADDLDIALHISNPDAWLALAAFLAFAIGVIVWSAFAVVPITTTTTALTDGGRTATCWVDAETAEQLYSRTARVSVAGKEATDVVVETRPKTSAEVKNSVGGGYLADGLELDKWNYQVDLEFAESLYTPDEMNGQESILAPAELVTKEEHPIVLVFGN